MDGLRAGPTRRTRSSASGWTHFSAATASSPCCSSPRPGAPCRNFFFAGDTLILAILDELRPVFLAVTPGAWTSRPLSGLPPIGTVAAWPLDTDKEESDGSLLAMAQDPLTPPTLLLAGPALAAPEILKRSPAAFDAAGLVVTQHEAISTDGERIPYTQSGPPGETGDAPVHLSGYGGFMISRLPTYSVALGKLWLGRGGTSVVANIRGGGEFRHALARGRAARGQAAQP